MHKQITIKTNSKNEFVDITSDVENIVKESGIKQGLCTVYVPHATAAITINENADPNVPVDIITFLKNIVPAGVWKHDSVDNNADAHIKSSIIGPSETIPIKDSKLLLGTWQDIFLCDFDGPRKRTIIIQLIDGDK